ncbi:MAG: hypothetical protein HRU41_33615 [Saprospiraceae bacterium]|nr:hypothetical protein [Saprospiraceae bacterium]
MAKQKTTRQDVASDSEKLYCDNKTLKAKSNFFLDCIRRISLFLGSNSHVLDLDTIQEDLQGLDDLSDELEKLRNQ